MMVRILAFSDDTTLRDNPLDVEVDALICCGDMDPSVIDAVHSLYKPWVSVMVVGNHDERYHSTDELYATRDARKRIAGCELLLEDVEVAGNEEYSPLSEPLTLAGYSGAPDSMRNRPFYFGPGDATKFVNSLKKHLIPEDPSDTSWFTELMSLFNKRSSLDIMVSHCAPDIGGRIEMDGLHKPSKELGDVYELFAPRFWFYGHIHRTYTPQQLDFRIEDTTPMYLINAHPYAYVEWERQNDHIDVYTIDGKIF